MSQIEIEKALSELLSLLASNVNEEAKYQTYFETNPIVFKLMGFTDAYSHINLQSINGDHYIPDFLLKHENGLFEVSDVKLPFEPIIKKQKYRDEFYSKISSEYAGQLRNYASYFSEKGNRDFIAKNYGLEVNENPKKIMIVGRNENLDRFLVHDILNSRGHEFTLITYDDIAEYLSHSLRTSFISEKQYYGTSFLLILKLNEIFNKNEKYIIDFGDDNEKNRFSIFLDNQNNLAFRVIDNDNNDLIIKAIKKRSQFNFNEYFYLHCSVGCSDDYSIMEMYINGSRLEKREFRYSLYKSRGVHFRKRFLATDMNKNNGADLIYELVKCFNHNLNFYDRTTEDAEFFHRLSWTKSQNKLCTVHFDEKAATEIEHKLGQKTPLHQGLEALWDVQNIRIGGKFVSEHRKVSNQLYSKV